MSMPSTLFKLSKAHQKGQTFLSTCETQVSILRFALIFTANGKKLQQRFNTNLQAMFVNDVLKEKSCVS